MENLSFYLGQTLEIKQPKLLQELYELMYGDEVLGTMKFPKIFSTRAEVKIMENEWEIKSESIWKGILGVYKKGNELPYVKFVPKNMRNGEISFYRGDYLNVKQYYFKSIIELHNNTGEIILTVKSKSAFKKKYWIEILQKNKLVDENPWIVFLLAYIIIGKEKRAHSAG